MSIIRNLIDSISNGKTLSTNDYTTVEKTKLTGIETGAQVNTVNSVAGKTGVISLTKSDVGLASVDNTADSAKNVLSATKLTTARTINGVSFDGSASITVVDSTKEPVITSGTTAQYLRGDKTWATMPTSLPASDVSSWAKASTKPTYAYSEITGTPTIPTALSSFTNDSDFQTATQVNTAIQSVVGAAPAALDTLGEIATQLANDESAVSALTNVVSTKANSADVYTKTTIDSKIDTIKAASGLTIEGRYAPKTYSGVYTLASDLISTDKYYTISGNNPVGFFTKYPNYGAALRVGSKVKTGSSFYGYSAGVAEFIVTNITMNRVDYKWVSGEASFQGSFHYYVDDLVDAITNYISNATSLSNADVLLDTAIASKQSTLISGTNIKTINGTSVLGPGDIQTVTLPSASDLYVLGSHLCVGSTEQNTYSVGSTYNLPSINGTWLCTYCSTVLGPMDYFFLFNFCRIG